jgi:riboflavin synthase
MFSGIIDKLGKVRSIKREAGALTCTITTGYDDLALGESVAVNGVCLTVSQSYETGEATFFASAETLARTNLGTLAVGGQVNLERAVSLNTRLSGHMVQGHVDGLGRLASVVAEDGAWRLGVEVPQALARYCVEKGSIALDGISLTINSLEDVKGGPSRIGLTIIPHTFSHTNLNAAQAGDALNIEVDVMAKYVERLCHAYQ